MTRQITIFDTTLRDGEQAPGFSMSETGKLSVALALQALKVDVIEAGFAAASPGDFKAVERIAARRLKARPSVRWRAPRRAISTPRRAR
jgi:2-isopropylmalate synthase